MSSDLNVIYDIERYRPLGLITNPFATHENGRPFDGIELETAAESNSLLGAIAESSRQEAAKPIVVTKSLDIPGSYHSRAVGLVQRSLVADPNINVLHAYVQLYMMRMGRIRAIISILSERLAYRQFNKTLELYIGKVLAEPDETLTAFQVLGTEGLERLNERFRSDPEATTEALFGKADLERHPELADLADPRSMGLEIDVEEDNVLPEIDETVGDSPANAILLAASDEDVADETENDDQEMVDYIVEYTKAHLSPVIARGLRVYRERGLVAMVEEFKITKAPKKTLAAIAHLARVRFTKVALIFDEFESWDMIDPATRSLIAGNLSEARWLMDRDTVMVFLLEKDGVAELQEQFGGGTRLAWDFPGRMPFSGNPDLLAPELVNAWLAKAGSPGAEPLSVKDPVLAELFASASGVREFAVRAGTAIEDAADRGVTALDEVALVAARAAEIPEARPV